ncbi:MAG: glycoside hydrolase family 28 protein, partial [Cyclobacteriaceae bacterium]|nr:glycoside hydrolase family 28 protein [Cyclobacteriaceae bacterium]
STRGRGGVVEKIYISNIDMMNIPTNAISFNLYYGGQSVSEMLAEKDGEKTEKAIPEVTEETPQFKDISIKNISCKGAFQAIYLQGLPEMNLENVTLENLTMEAENGLLCIDANGITINDLNLKTINSPVLTFFNAKNVDVSGLKLNDSVDPLISVSGEKTENVNIGLFSKKKIERILKLGKNVDKKAVKISRIN